MTGEVTNLLAPKLSALRVCMTSTRYAAHGPKHISTYESKSSSAEESLESQHSGFILGKTGKYPSTANKKAEEAYR